MIHGREDDDKRHGAVGGGEEVGDVQKARADGGIVKGRVGLIAAGRRRERLEGADGAKVPVTVEPRGTKARPQRCVTVEGRREALKTDAEARSQACHQAARHGGLVGGLVF